MLALLCLLVGATWLLRAALADPNQGPGGPILVVTSPASTYGKYYAEILRNEGLIEAWLFQNDGRFALKTLAKPQRGA